METLSVKPSELAKALQAVCESGLVPYIQSAPGIGKSAITDQLAKGTGRWKQDRRLAYLDPTQLQGYLTLVEGETCWTRPANWPSDEDGPGVILYDELSSAPRAVQCAAYQILLDRCIGEFKLPDNVWQIAAGNRAIDRSVVNQVGAALKSRLVTITLEPDKDDLVAYAIASNWPSEVIGFLNFSPASVFNFDGKKWDGESSFACPRTWEFVAKMIPKLTPSLQFRLLAGAVGAEEAAKFGAFLQVYKDLPDFKQIYSDPDNAPIPVEPSVLYAVCSKLAVSANKKNIGASLRYARRMTKDFEILTGRDIYRGQASLRSTPEMVQWFKDNSSVILGE